jgi:hypothetical protein
VKISFNAVQDRQTGGAKLTREMLLGLSRIPYFLDFIRRRLNGRDGITADCLFQAGEQQSATDDIAVVQPRRL